MFDGVLKSRLYKVQSHHKLDETTTP